MKKVLIFLSLFLILSITMHAQMSNKKYEQDWKLVESKEKEDLPKSAIEEVDKILKKAITDKNNPQAIKALIFKNKYKKTIDQNDNLGLFKDLQERIVQTTDVSEKALLNSMLSELYIDFYNSNKWIYDERTAITGNVPDDILEWSSNIFIDKAIAHIDLSVKEKALLKNHKTAEYNDIIDLGKDGERYYPTLYDFLMFRAVNIAKVLHPDRWQADVELYTGLDAKELSVPAKDFVKLNIQANGGGKYIVYTYYQQFLKDLLERNIQSTLALTDLDKLTFLKDNYSVFYSTDELNALLALEKEYAKEEASVEIVAEISKALLEANDLDQAYDWIQKGLKTYPNYHRIGLLKNMLTEMQQPSLSVKGKDVYTTRDAVKMDLTYKNLQDVGEPKVLRLYKTSEDEHLVLKEIQFNKTSEKQYVEATDSIDLGKLTPGRYRLAYISRDADTNIANKSLYTFVVTDLTSFWRNSKDKEYEIYVVDRISGKPIVDATVDVTPEKYDSDERKWKTQATVSLKTDKLGLATYKDAIERDNKGSYRDFYSVRLNADSCLAKTQFYNNRGYYYTPAEDEVKDEYRVSIFTERGIYRPGQTVYYKAIVAGKNKPVAKKQLTVNLYNANNESIAKTELVTNEFGSIAGEFVLPTSGLTGHYHIMVGAAIYYFNVEEYKRPTFEITFDTIANTYKFGENVTIKGYAKNFSDISLQNADVAYTIVRSSFNFWRPWGSDQLHFGDGTVKTNDDGLFEISFVPQASEDAGNTFWKSDIFNFEISAVVTDVNGETQSGTTSLMVGRKSMQIGIEVPDQIEKNSDFKIDIKAMNLNRKEIQTEGSYTIYSLDDNDSIKAKVFDGAFKTGEQKQIKERVQKLRSGKYQLLVKALDSNKNEVEQKANFVLFSYADKKPPIKSNEWLVKKNTTFSNTKPAEVIFGVSDKDFYVYYKLYNNDKVFEHKIVTMSSSNQLFKVPYKAEYGDRIYMTLTYVKNEKMYSENIQLQKEIQQADETLVVKTEVFRDKLRPGQEETWTLSIKNKKGESADAEVLASMYDISLDKLNPYPSDWRLDRPYSFVKPLDAIYFNNNLYSQEGYPRSYVLPIKNKQIDVESLKFDELNWFGYFDPYYELYKPSFGSGRILARASGVRMGKQSLGYFDMALNEEATPSSSEVALVADSVSAPIGAPEAGGGSNATESAPQIRRNFNETAFFFPQLRTNDKGETQISFTVPESNTTWRFRAFAHDKNLKVGKLESLVMTRKELMVTPNMPRFVRQGDKTSISTKVSNLSENAVAGNVRIEFFDPLTDKAIDLNVPNKTQSFSIEKDKSTSVSWTFDVPKNIELLGCRIIAQNELFSDGEQHVLSVLPNRMLVTEAMPFDVDGSGKSTFTFDKMAKNESASLSNYKLTFEYANNPAWYAVQALPTMSNPSNENAINWFASYYVNSMGLSILKQYPKVSAMIEAWKKQGGTKETLVSKLQKDEELKSVLLEETPWVLEAKDETEQMQRLSLLFDANNTKQTADIALRKLAELQNDNGGWSWYKGLYPSRGIAQYILYGFSQLQLVGKIEYPTEVKTMQMQALKYIDEQLKNEFENMKKYNTKWKETKSVTTSQLEFMYVRSFYRDIPIDHETREAERFYADVASKNWTKLDMYQRSIFIPVLISNGDKLLAEKIAKSVREYSVVDKSMGMYWPNIKGNVFLSMSAVSKHTFMMEAMKATGATEKDMDLMKKWLLKQKQTQVWESTHATMDAVNALLKYGNDWFAAEKSSVSIKIGNKPLSTDKSELGTGYIKQTWDKESITKDMATVEIDRADNAPAYGALYWQYYEDMDNVTKQNGNLNVNKELYKEVVTNAGKTLQLVSAENPLRVGDKVIIRLTVRTDRDMEFVQLKDLRASCFEPAQTISGAEWQNRIVYYKAIKDASTNYYFDNLPKGTYVFEYPVYVNRTGEYSNGTATIQCLYAPEFVSHTQGVRVVVGD